ncbi:MAG: glycosyl hydrolase family 17 [Saprospiraceae bacterium]
MAATQLLSYSSGPGAADKTAADILGNPDFQAISFGGYRENSRAIQPTIPELKEDLLILSAMGVKLLRTYNVYYNEAANLLEAIRQIKQTNKGFEMYVMLGAWIDCKNAWTDLPPDHNLESEKNAAEIDRAVALAVKYPDIVKIIAVGNEAMVKWAERYYVQPGVILKWVTHLQNLKKQGALPATLWITCSDNFASWGGGDTTYHVDDLNRLIEAVDYISMHTYPMHDTHYNPFFWHTRQTETGMPDQEKVEAAMLRARDYAKTQYEQVVRYMKSLGIQKPVHIGETGWASSCNELYGNNGSRAVDEYKSARYYHLTREWTNAARITCFYFEAFDEPWKDAANPGGSENHFGLFTVKGQAKFAIWELVDSKTFKGLKRGGKPISKTHKGNKNAVMKTVHVPTAAR